MMITVAKNKSHVLTQGLNALEYQCNCTHKSCRSVMISSSLVEAYGKFRERVAMALKINSGNRCALHNFNEGGAPMSRHVTGEAIDLEYVWKKLWTVDETIKVLKECGFTFILFYKVEEFFHCDVRGT